MARAYCSLCRYPLTTCLCPSVRKVACQTQFDILQHPSEEKAAKNTARLAKLCIPNIKLSIAEQAEQFSELRSLLENEQRLIDVFHAMQDTFKQHDHWL